MAIDKKLRSILDKIQASALRAADPFPCTLRALRREGSDLQVDGRRYPLSHRRVFLAGMGRVAYAEVCAAVSEAEIVRPVVEQATAPIGRLGTIALGAAAEAAR